MYIWGSDRGVRYVLGEIVYGCACFGVGTTEQFGIGKDFVCLQQLQKENEMLSEAHRKGASGMSKGSQNV